MVVLAVTNDVIRDGARRMLVRSLVNASNLKCQISKGQLFEI